MTIHQAIEALRGRLSQKAFAEEFGISTSALQKYEADRVPDVEPLWRFLQAAESRGQYDVAKVLRSAYEERVKVPKSWEGFLPVEPRDSFETFLTAGLLAAFRNESMRHLRPAILKALDEPLTRVGQRVEERQLQIRFAKMQTGARRLADEQGAGHWSEKDDDFAYYTLPADWQKTYITDEGVPEQIAKLDAESKRIKRERGK